MFISTDYDAIVYVHQKNDIQGTLYEIIYPEVIGACDAWFICGILMTVGSWFCWGFGLCEQFYCGISCTDVKSRKCAEISIWIGYWDQSSFYWQISDIISKNQCTSFILLFDKDTRVCNWLFEYPEFKYLLDHTVPVSRSLLESVETFL